MKQIASSTMSVGESAMLNPSYSVIITYEYTSRSRCTKSNQMYFLSTSVS